MRLRVLGNMYYMSAHPPSLLELKAMQGVPFDSAQRDRLQSPELSIFVQERDG